MTDRDRIEAAFRRVREELGIRTGFPDDVLREADAAAQRGEAAWKGTRRDLTAVPFVTIDPPGSRDLDQALHIERRGKGFRVCYAIADVACFVERGGALEREAWLRGVTFYAPDHREPLYPPVLSQGAASLLAREDRPAVVFTLDLDARGALTATRVERARVRSRAQLTYHQALAQVEAGGLFDEEPFADTLALLRRVGELRLERERERGGVSLPIRDQHVQQHSALQLGYQLVYEEPNVAEEWNAQISLLTGHAAALRMRAAGMGLLRTMAPAQPEDVARFRLAARALGFAWPDDLPYAGFMHGLDAAHDNIEPLVWQARRVMRGADYVALDGEPERPLLHAALAMPYAHCTAPLRRLADRYVLDLLVDLEGGDVPPADQRARLAELPRVMDEAERKANRLERRVVDIAEAWMLRDRVGERFAALVLDAQAERMDAQLGEPPVRARIPLPAGTPPLSPGQRVEVRPTRVEVEEGRVDFELATP